MTATAPDRLREALGTRGEVTTVRGRVAYWTRGEGPPIVFLHGIGVNALLWRKVVPKLATRFRCVCLELPLGGHDIPMPRDADLSVPAIADLAHEVIERLGLTDVTVVGSDTGGAIAQLLATRHPERMGRLVLTPTDAFEHFLPPEFRYLQALAWVPGAAWVTAQSLRSLAVRRLPFAYGWLVRRPLPPEVSEAYARPALRYAIRRDLAKVLRAIRRRYTLEAAEALRTFRRPVLIVWPPEDRVFRFRNAERLAEIIPDARLVPIEDSRGFVSEDQPERLAEEIERFCTETA